MISDHFEIDKHLITKFFENNPGGITHEISNMLIDWYGSLQSSNPELIRKKARLLLRHLAEYSLRELHLPEEKQKQLIDVFEPLELLFRTAISLKSDTLVRDHLSHTVRNFLFSNFIFNKYPIYSNKELYKKTLTVASIFHDIAYPIEKFKAATKSLKDELFVKCLNSQGIIDFKLSDPDILLDVLHNVGSLSDDPLPLIYKEIVAPAIAGKGLFDSPHCLCSVVLFLRSIILDWENTRKYWRSKSKEIGDICLTMAYHDRKMFPPLNFISNLSISLKSLRIADELQEWGRDKQSVSFIDDVFIEEKHPDEMFQIKLKMKNSVDKPCVPEIAVADKLLGLLPINELEKIKLVFLFPNKIEKAFGSRLSKRINNAEFINYNIAQVRNYLKHNVSNPNGTGKKVIVQLYNGKAEISLHD